jgi:hypothetical protein
MLDCFLAQQHLVFAPAPPVYGGAASPILFVGRELNSLVGDPFLQFFVRVAIVVPFPGLVVLPPLLEVVNANNKRRLF